MVTAEPIFCLPQRATVRTGLKSKFALRTQMVSRVPKTWPSVKRDLIGLDSSGDDPWTNQLQGRQYINRPLEVICGPQSAYFQEGGFQFGCVY